MHIKLTQGPTLRGLSNQLRPAEFFQRLLPIIYLIIKRLQTIQKDLEKLTNVHILNFDVRNKEATFNAIQSLPGNFKRIDILINNAGNAHGLDFINEGSIDAILAKAEEKKNKVLS